MPADSAAALAARLRVDTPTMTAALEEFGLWEGGPTPDALALIDICLAGPNPDLVLIAFRRLADHHPEVFADIPGNAQLLQRAAVVSGTSEALGELLATQLDPGLLSGPVDERDAEQVEADCLAAVRASDDPGSTLALCQRAGLLRVAARDLLGLADTPAATRELSALADGVLRAALEVAAAGAPSDLRMAVIGMGKHGGRELNYVSDVDVLFVHEGDYAAATQVAERFLRLCAQATPWGRPYEVDTNLRPEGRDGPLTRSLDAYQAYYDRWAKTWEYQALLKARPFAGDEALGKAFADLVAPYVWPEKGHSGAVDEIQRMKTVVERSEPVRKAGTREVKLAPGGLRDIEFAVQLLQLVHGRHDASLRSPNTLEALAALADGGYIDDGDASLFGDAYQFLRTVEHRLQLRRLHRTHVVPSSADERYRLARSSGFRDLRAASALQQFDSEFARVQGYVRRLHEKLFYRPLLDRFAELSAEEQLPLREGGRLDDEAARKRLAALGFQAPEQALRHLEALAAGVSRSARLMRTLLPAILPTLADSPDPDVGLASFRSLADRLGSSPFFLRTLRDTPPVGELLARVLGGSRRVGEWLERQPEVFGQLADLGALDERLTLDDYQRLTHGLLRRRDNPDRTADALRRLKRREVVRVAVRDLSGRSDIREVAGELSDLAEATLEAGVALAAADSEIRFAVIGMGKLGGRELGYSSDLDVILLFEPGEKRDEALRAAEGMVHSLSSITTEGRTFLVDLGLRPEGKDGPIARTLRSTLTYYERWSATWEVQALTQARPVAGDREMGAEFIEAIQPILYPERPPPTRLQQVRQMKARIERERAGGKRSRLASRRGDRTDLKLGPGGLSDVEWTLQLLQLKLGGRIPALRAVGALPVLQVVEAEGVLDAEEAAWLREGWLLLSRARNALYLAGARDNSLLPQDPQELERLANMLGYLPPGGQALMEDLARVMRRVRKVHERNFYE